MIPAGIGNKGMLERVSVLVLFIFIHLPPSIPIMIWFLESFLTSEYASPVAAENEDVPHLLKSACSEILFCYFTKFHFRKALPFNLPQPCFVTHERVFVKPS